MAESTQLQLVAIILTLRTISEFSSAHVYFDPKMGVITAAVFFLFLFAVVTSTTNGLVELHANKVVTAQCHSRVTLHCNISSLNDLSVMLLTWIHEKTGENLCLFDSKELHEPDARILCSYRPEKQLALTFKNVSPSHQGTYICKLRSNQGMKHVSSVVKVQECHGTAEQHSSPSQVQCHFHGVYPQGEVHWFFHKKNVTLDATPATCTGPDHKGLYNVTSNLHTDKTTGNYTCSLWIPINRDCPVNIKVRMPPSSRAASRHIVGLGWALLHIWRLIV
ncbi:hypothetical protein MATL_G00006380 [Megalops atlanticus]|uniref:Ig-like domain-containing protein n=1 Tax=Megalops atlanticus TaxID=7932 RepID=A0A9D3TH76_MEGAT|nr:hypothetical protein MATL_G00006380 [Megalops atlanticus]